MLVVIPSAITTKKIVQTDQWPKLLGCSCSPASDGEEPLLASIAWALSRMTQLTELHVAFSTLTGKLQTLLG